MSSIKIKKERLWELVSYKNREWHESGHTNVPSTPPPSCNANLIAATHLLDEVRCRVQVNWNACVFVVPLAQRIARWTSNPKVVGSTPTRDEF